jgi:hypothetical protein
MSTLVVRNSRQGEEPVTPPTHDDGTLYPYCMYYDGAKFAAFADDPTDLIAVLVPGYQDLNEADRLQARIRLAIDAQVRTQALINAEADRAEWEALTDEQRTVLSGPRFEQPRVDFWDPQIVLVLVETGYAPYTDIDQPISGIADVQNPPNILWLRPLDEWDLLESLAQAGFIGLHQATDL